MMWGYEEMKRYELMTQTVKFSCVIGSAANPENWNESLNIKNPYGVEEMDIAFTKIRLALIACGNMPIAFIVLDICTSPNEEKYTKIALGQEQLLQMDIRSIETHLLEQTKKAFSKRPKRKRGFIDGKKHDTF